MLKENNYIDLNKYEDILSRERGKCSYDGIDRLLDWVEITPLFKKKDIRLIQTHDSILFRATIESNSSIRGRPIIGCGRATSPKEAILKAAMEVVERHFCNMTYENMPTVPSINATLESYNIFSVKHDSLSSLPPLSYRTTNGWAAHTHLRSAVQNSISEAMERHLLQVCLFSLDESFRLKKLRDCTFMNRNCAMYTTPFSYLGYSSGLVQCKSVRHPGNTYGYMCDMGRNIIDSDKWRHALLEAAESCLIFDDMSFDQIEAREKEFPSDYISRVQNYYLLNVEKQIFSIDTTEKKFEIVSKPIEIEMLMMNVGPVLNAPVSIYVTWVKSCSLLPLCFGKYIEHDELPYLQNIITNIDYTELKVPLVHPIL